MKGSLVVVAGATGYLGRHLSEALPERGYLVRALVRAGKSYAAPGVECVEVDVTRPETLVGAFEGASAVFSALGITRQTDKVSYEEIEYQANMNLAAEAQRAGVERFGVISAIHPERFAGLAIMDSRERFIREMQSAAMDLTVVRATGFFSDLKEVLQMAQGGRVYLLGSGQQRINPIHGADLAQACIDAWLEAPRGSLAQIEVGGPDVFSWNEVAELAFHCAGKPAKVSRVPLWIPSLLLPLLRPFNQRAYDVGQFMTHGASADMLATPCGTRRLSDFYSLQIEDTRGEKA